MFCRAQSSSSLSGVAVGFGVAVAVAVAVAVGEAVGLGEAVGEGDAVAVTVGDGDAVAVAVGDGKVVGEAVGDADTVGVAVAAVRFSSRGASAHLPSAPLAHFGPIGANAEVLASNLETNRPQAMEDSPTRTLMMQF